MTAQLQQLIDKIQQISAVSDPELIKRDLLPVLNDAITNPDWVKSNHYELVDDQDWVLHTIFSEEDNPISVFITAWKPGGSAPPHTHGSWAIIGGVKGVEKNIIWRRTDDGEQTGYAEIEPIQTIHCGPGDVVVLSADDIHSVVNEGDKVSLGLHIYGCHPDLACRDRFDVAKRTVEPFVTIPASVNG